MTPYPRLSLINENHISKVSCLIQNSVADTYPLHCHYFYEFFYVVSGKAIHQVNNTTQVISEGALFFIRPDDVHAYSFLTNYDIKLLSCGIEPDLMESTCKFLNLDLNFIKEPAFPPYIILDASKRWDILNDFQQIEKKEAGTERTRYFLTILPKLIYLFYSSAASSPEVLPIWFKKLIEEMEQPENFICGLEKLLKLSNVRQEHLNREFRRLLGITPTEYINMKRINHAGKLLLTRQYEILDICYMSGYHNLSYFYKMFKKQYHCTPLEFAKKYASPAE